MTEALRPVDPSTIPQLSGRFEPVSAEIKTDALTVEGRLPSDLTGAYFRNGPNPKFTPLGSYTYPLEGDGMVHGLWIEKGSARYANRWVRTKGMAAEERAGHSIYGGLMTPAFVDTALLGNDPDPGWPFRLDPFINVVRHAGRYLALEEGTPPYEITDRLDTVGLFDFGGALPAGLCAHPKIDPITGEMIVFRYDVEAPFLTWAVIGPDGTVTTTTYHGGGCRLRIHDPRFRHHRAPSHLDHRPRRLRSRRDVQRWAGAPVATSARNSDRHNPSGRLVRTSVDPRRGFLGLALRQRVRASRATNGWLPVR